MGTVTGGSNVTTTTMPTSVYTRPKVIRAIGVTRMIQRGKWDAENRLVRVETQPSAAAPPAPPALAVPPKRVQYSYDYRGRMVRRQVFTGTYSAGPPATINWSSTADTAAGADVIFLYDGWQCVAALKPDQTLYQAYLWGTDLSGRIGGAGGVGGL